MCESICSLIRPCNHLPLGVAEASLVETFHHLWGEDCGQFVRHPDRKLREEEIFMNVTFHCQQTFAKLHSRILVGGGVTVGLLLETWLRSTSNFFQDANKVRHIDALTHNL